MKCGSCRDMGAESYKKINEQDSIFEILKKLNPRRVYNSNHTYFCGICIKLAMAKQCQTISSISDQNANSFTINASISSNTTDSSKDEFDYLVMSKLGNAQCEFHTAVNCFQFLIRSTCFSIQ